MRHALPLIFVLATVCDAQQSDDKISDVEERILELTNAARKKQDLKPLKISGTLNKVARAHSTNMAKYGEMKHDLDGKSPFDRIKAASYKYSTAAENIARGDVNVDTIMKAWMDSKIHRENILDADFTEIGLGLAKDGKGQVYYTQIFASPRK